MRIEGWKYYNHAAIPTCAPHEEPNLTPIKTGEIWKLSGKPLLARWTTDFDCKKETNWWYTVRFAPFSLEQLSRSSRKHIRQALKKCCAKRISVAENLDALYKVYYSAFEKYENADNQVAYEAFCEGCIAQEKAGCEYWGGYDIQKGDLIGYMVVCPFDEYAELHTAKFRPSTLNSGVSAALYCTVLNHYLNTSAKRYISSGSRSINHKTNTEEYKIRHFGYKKVHCNLHVAYSPIMAYVIRLLYPFRRFFMYLDKNTRIHQINAVLKMEEIARNEE